MVGIEVPFVAVLSLLLHRRTTQTMTTAMTISPRITPTLMPIRAPRSNGGGADAEIAIDVESLLPTDDEDDDDVVTFVINVELNVGVVAVVVVTISVGVIVVVVAVVVDIGVNVVKVNVVDVDVVSVLLIDVGPKRGVGCGVATEERNNVKDLKSQIKVSAHMVWEIKMEMAWEMVLPSDSETTMVWVVASVEALAAVLVVLSVMALERESMQQ